MESSLQWFFNCDFVITGSSLFMMFELDSRKLHLVLGATPQGNGVY